MSKRPLISLVLTFMIGILIGHAFLEGTANAAPAIILSCIFFLSLYFFLPGRFKLATILLVSFLLGAALQFHSQAPSRILPLALHRHKVIIEGTLIEPLQRVSKRAKMRILAQTVFFRGKAIPVHEKVLGTIYRRVPPLLPGEKIRFPAKLKPFRNFRNPGAYDYETGMKIKGFSCSAAISDGRSIVPLGKGSLPFPHGLLEKGRRPIRRFLHQHLVPEDESLFRALILGERRDIKPSLRKPFLRAGLGHVLAVSGLHIGLVAWVAFFFFTWLLTRSYRLTLTINVRKSVALLTCVPVVTYACLAGLQVSSQRAMIMALIFFGSILLDREKEMWSTLSLAALIILVLDPMALFSISFQLSFGAVIGILWLTSPLLSKRGGSFEKQSGIRHLCIRLRRNLTGLVAISLAAQIFLLPLTVHYFHRISPVALFANLTTIPLLGLWIIPAGLLSALLLFFSPSAATLVLAIGATGLHAMMALIRFWAELPFASFWMFTPNTLEIGLFYALLLCLFSLKKGNWTRPALVFLLAIAVLDTGYWVQANYFRQQLRVTFLDVGQGSSAVVEFPGGKRMVIDGGGFSGSHFDVGRNVVAPFLWHSKVLHVDYLVLSHPQADHMNGLVFLAKAFHVKEFWYNGDSSRNPVFTKLMNVISSRKIKTFLPADLQRRRSISRVHVRLLYPPPKTHQRPYVGEPHSLNNRSLVLKLTYQGHSFLFPGDIEQKGEKVLLERACAALKSRVLLVPHHGSNTSSSKPFLAAVEPEIGVISCGERNRFGFPQPAAIGRLRAMGCSIRRTDRDGAIQIIVSDKEGPMDVRTFMNHWQSVPLGMKKTERDGVFPPSLSEDPGNFLPGRVHRRQS